MGPKKTKEKDSERFYLRPNKDESDDVFADRFAKMMVDAEQRYRKEYGLPPLTDDLI
jgi:hypothetical protein